MLLSSIDCRKNARLCLDLAEKADTPTHAQTLRHIAEAWLKLADELPASNAPIAHASRRTPATNVSSPLRSSR
jgi:hypothetical protein